MPKKMPTPQTFSVPAALNPGDARTLKEEMLTWLTAKGTPKVLDLTPSKEGLSISAVQMLLAAERFEGAEPITLSETAQTAIATYGSHQQGELAET